MFYLHNESFILFFFIEDFKRMEGCRQVSFTLLFRVNSPNISISRIPCFLHIPTIFTAVLKYYATLKLEKVFKLRCKTRWQKNIASFSYIRHIWQLDPFSELCNIVCNLFSLLLLSIIFLENTYPDKPHLAAMQLICLIRYPT